MRRSSSNGAISVHAISGTQTVVLGLDATPAALKGLLGFIILRRKGLDGALEPLVGRERRFANPEGGAPIDVAEPPIQRFVWIDIPSATEPSLAYRTFFYRVIPVYGEPSAMRRGDGVDVTITLEDASQGVHGVFFNRIAADQEFNRRFQEYRRWYLVSRHGRVAPRRLIKPENVPGNRAFEWLSSGLEEAMTAFIEQATGPEYAIRAAVYELNHLPVIRSLVAALERGVDVKIIHHGKPQREWRVVGHRGSTITYYEKGGDGEWVAKVGKNRRVERHRVPDFVARATEQALSEVGVRDGGHLEAYRDMIIPRTNVTIAHNKFMVLLRDGGPLQVWTGSTNLTQGGLYGRWNCGHIVRDESVARRYSDYWQKLSTDPKKWSSRSDPADAGIRDWNVLHQPDLEGAPPPNSMTAIFSPRSTRAMLDWYADRLDAADSSVFLSATFGVAPEFFDKMITEKKVGDKPYLRYLLFEGIRGLKDRYRVMAECRQNRIAWGETLRRGDSSDARLIEESLTGLSEHVKFVHAKMLLVDPLSDDPLVITGSGNFSVSSVRDNDENMLVIRGNKRVADIYLTEFMRMFESMEYRNTLNRLADQGLAEEQLLVPDDSWVEPYFTQGSPEQQERSLSRAPLR